MTENFSPQRSHAIREDLIQTVERDTRRSILHGARRWIATGVLVLASLGAGAGISAAAFAASAPESSGPESIEMTKEGIPAPPGVMPGQPIISLLGTTTMVTTQGDATVPLPERPSGATHVRLSMHCLTPGTTAWTLDAGRGGDGGSIECTPETVDTAGGGYQDLELAPETTSLKVTAELATSTVFTFQYVNYVATQLGVNAKGQMYGVESPGHPAPDLVYVQGTAPDGSFVNGYSLHSDLSAFGPDSADQPSSPEEALTWQKERDEKYPNGWDIPVYKSDGETVIGTFHIG